MAANSLKKKCGGRERGCEGRGVDTSAPGVEAGDFPRVAVLGDANEQDVDAAFDDYEADAKIAESIEEDGHDFLQYSPMEVDDSCELTTKTNDHMRSPHYNAHGTATHSIRGPIGSHSTWSDSPIALLSLILTLNTRHWQCQWG